MSKIVELDIDGVFKKPTEINLEDLKWLYLNFYKINGRYPTTADGVSKNNLPQGRIIKNILTKNNLTMSEFLTSIGKVSNVRSKPEDYNKYVEKFKYICSKEGKVLLAKELSNNIYGLPNIGYFIKYCPNKEVKNFKDFIRWCGYDREECYEITKEKADKALIEFQNKIGVDKRISKKDINFENVGFSMIVINRLYGNLKNAKKELGLNMKAPCYNPKPFSYYKNKLDYVLNLVNTKILSWSIIESIDIENDTRISHKSMLKSFNDNNVDFYKYIKEKGFLMKESTFGNSFMFEDGERTQSNFEYLFSKELKEKGYKYKQHYKRDVLYKTIDNTIKRKINCDYLINNTYIEIAGMINPTTNNWRTEKYPSKKENDYRDNLLEKEKILIENNKKYIILFPYDFVNGNYKDIINKI